MSVHERIVRELKSDLAQLFNLPVDAVYSGDRPQKVTRVGAEVWIKPGASEPADAYLTLHPYEVHVRLKARRGADGAGEVLTTALKEHLRQVTERYDSQRPFVAVIATLVASKAEEREVEEPEDDGTLDGHVLVSFVEL